MAGLYPLALNARPSISGPRGSDFMSAILSCSSIRQTRTRCSSFLERPSKAATRRTPLSLTVMATRLISSPDPVRITLLAAHRATARRARSSLSLSWHTVALMGHLQRLQLWGRRLPFRLTQSPPTRSRPHRRLWEPLP